MIDFLIQNKEWFLAIVTGLFGVLTGTKLKRQKLWTIEIQNLQAVRDEEKKLLEDMRDLIKKDREIISDYEKTINSLNAKIKALNVKVREQDKKIKELIKNLKK